MKQCSLRNRKKNRLHLSLKEIILSCCDFFLVCQYEPNSIGATTLKQTVQYTMQVQRDNNALSKPHLRLLKWGKFDFWRFKLTLQQFSDTLLESNTDSVSHFSSKLLHSSKQHRDSGIFALQDLFAIRKTRCWINQQWNFIFKTLLSLTLHSCLSWQ